MPSLNNTLRSARGAITRTGWQNEGKTLQLDYIISRSSSV